MYFLNVWLWALEGKDETKKFGLPAQGGTLIRKNAWMLAENIKCFYESTMKDHNDSTCIDFLDGSQLTLAMTLKEFEKMYFDEIKNNKKSTRKNKS